MKKPVQFGTPLIGGFLGHVFLHEGIDIQTVLVEHSLMGRGYLIIQALGIPSVYECSPEIWPFLNQLGSIFCILKEYIDFALHSFHANEIWKRLVYMTLETKSSVHDVHRIGDTAEIGVNICFPLYLYGIIGI